MQATRGAPLGDRPAPADAEQDAGVPATRRAAWAYAIAGATVAADAVSKVLVVADLTPGRRVTLVPGVLWLDLTRNPGAAFSVGTGATWLFSALAVVIAVVIVRRARTLTSRGWAVALGLILGGAVGNLVDRLVRSPGPLRGHVVDWIELPHWPVFNLADSAICVGGALVVLLTLMGRPLEPEPTS